MAIQSTDVTTSELIVNQIPQDIYDAKKENGELDAGQLWLTPAAQGEGVVRISVQTLTEEQQEQARTNIGAEKAGTGYTKPASGIPKSDLAQSVQTSLAKADAAISLGLTAATPGQIIKVKTVQDGKPTEWEAVNPDYTLTVTVSTKDGVTVTGQTVTVRAGDADGPVYGTAEYNGQPVSFRVPDGFAYYAEVTDNLAAHFMPTTVKGVINGANAAVTLLYNDLSTIQTASDIQAALDADVDLTELVGQQITCQRGNDTLSWDVVDYDSTAKVVTLCTHDTLPEAIQFEPPQALMYCEDGLAAGSYTFKWNNTQCYFTLTQAIPAGGQLMATNRAFQTYESVTATAQIESGTVSTEAIDGATNLGQTGTGNLNHHDRANYGSNNFGESGILQWLNSDSPANTPLPRLTKFSRPYVPTKAGFKAGLDADFLACIQDTVWKCSANNVYECPASLGGIAKKGNPYTVTAKFALASEIEVFGEYGGTQDGGTVWDLYVGAEATDRIKYYNNTARSWWLRSPYWNITSRERNVNTSGAGIYNYANHSNGVAVACKIAKSKADLSDISYDISLGITAATPGQIIKVKAVQDGKPTGWEAVNMPGGDKWEKIKEITIAEGAEESNALTINADENGNTFRLKKARLCAKFPAYTGTSTIPNYSFAMINGKTTGGIAPLLYTSVWPKISTSGITGTIYYVDVSGAQQIEHAQVSTSAIWSNNASNAYNIYGSSSDQRKTIYGDTLWAKPITSIGGVGMLIYPGCHFVLYGVRE